MYYEHKSKSGKNSKLWYYLSGLVRFYGPSGHLRRGLAAKLASVNAREDRAEILDRVDYYNRLAEMSDPGPQASPVSRQNPLKGKSVYVLDTQEYLRWFPGNYVWNYIFGDLVNVPNVPAIVKSRPLGVDNTNSVLLNLDKVRHFVFLEDKIPFAEKEGRLIFRGDVAGKPRRIDFMEKFFGNPMCDVAAIARPELPHPEWGSAQALPLWEHLRCRYIMALEGNDVASNLKWVMSSNSVAVMPQPTCETWFMEGRLVPEMHYIEVRPDYSDLIEKLEYYESHPEDAAAIALNANRFVEQFLDPEREELTSLMVLDKYFRMTRQR